MKVKELIALLLEQDQELDVFTHANEDLGNPRSVITCTKNDQPYFKGDSAHFTYNITPETQVVYISERRPRL